MQLNNKITRRRCWLQGFMPAFCIALGVYHFYPQLPIAHMVLGAKTLVPSLSASLSPAVTATAGAAMGENQWQNPITLKQADLVGWTVKSLATAQGSAASSFTSDSAVVNLSVANTKDQSLTALVSYLKSNESALRFINQGIYGQTSGLPNWTGIATSTGDHDKSYVVHVTNAPTGYGILIASLNQQTAGSVSRLEVLMAQLDQTFKVK